MAKKLESSQVTAKHIKKVTREPEAVQVNLLRHQRTELIPIKFQRKQNKRYKSRQPTNKNYQEHTSFEDRCSKCGDTQHIEGFRCPASRYQCKHCHKFGHFSKLCYKKEESEYKKNTRKPKSHQLMVGRASAVCGQSDASYSSSEDSFCLQMQVKSAQEKTKMNKPQHLVTNIEYKLKPQRRRTKFLRAKIDTCSNVNLMPISVYKLMYKDEDCTKLTPSNKVEVETYTIEKIKIVGSCKLFVVHPDTKCLQEVTFQVVNQEGSVIISCATSIDLNLLQPHRDIDAVPEEGSLIYSKADMPVKQKTRRNQEMNNLIQCQG